MKKSLSNERGVTIITVTLMIIVITIILHFSWLVYGFLTF